MTSAKRQEPGAPAPAPTRRPCPEARGAPLVGVLPALMKDALSGLSRAAYEHPEAIVAVPLGPMRAYLVTHPPHVEHVLHTRWRNYVKGGPMWPALQRLLGNGLVTSEGEDWVQSRRLMQPLFHHKALEGLTERMVATIQHTLEELAQRTRDGRPIQMHQEMNVLTQNIILESVFDVTIDRSEAEHLGLMLANAFRAINLRMFLGFLPKGLPLPGEQSLRKAVAEIDEGLMRLTRRWEQTSRGERISLLGLMRQAADPETGQGFSAQQVRDELVTLWVAGNETTANLMTWVWYLLDRHPEVEARVRAEVETVLGRRTPTYADVGPLRFTRQVLQESMRLYPPSWIIPRQSVEEDVIDGYVVPADSVVLCSQYVTHRAPSLWEKPETFDPDRFSPERVAGRHPYAFLPFGGGPRRCIGEHFGLMEAQLITAMMLQRFRPRLVPGTKVEAQSATGLRPKGTVPMTLLPV